MARGVRVPLIDCADARTGRHEEPHRASPASSPRGRAIVDAGKLLDLDEVLDRILVVARAHRRGLCGHRRPGRAASRARRVSHQRYLARDPCRDRRPSARSWPARRAHRRAAAIPAARRRGGPSLVRLPARPSADAELPWCPHPDPRRGLGQRPPDGEKPGGADFDDDLRDVVALAGGGGDRDTVSAWPRPGHMEGRGASPNRGDLGSPPEVAGLSNLDRTFAPLPAWLVTNLRARGPTGVARHAARAPSALAPREAPARRRPARDVRNRLLVKPRRVEVPGRVPR